MSISAEQMAQLTGMYENAGSLQKKEIEQKYKISKDQLANAYKIALMESGDRRTAIEATREYQRGQLEQARQEMERIGIPRMEIEKYTAEKNYEIAQGELAYKQQALAEETRQYEKEYGLKEGALTGMFGGQQTLEARMREAEEARLLGGLTGRYGGQDTLEAQELRRRFGLSEADVTGMYGGQQTLEAQELQRRYGLDVAKYGTELASQPDRYFQARRFQALDAPRLLGQDTSGVAFGGQPTPQIQTMGAMLGGPQAGGPQAGGPQAGGPQAGGPQGGSQPYGATVDQGQMQGITDPGYRAPDPATRGATYNGGAVGVNTYGGNSYGGPSSAVEPGVQDDRYKQIAQIAKASPPSPYDGLDDQDTATLKLMENVYKRGGQGIQGGELERMGTAGRGFIKSAGSLLGHDYADLERQYLAYRPAQDSSRLA